MRSLFSILICMVVFVACRNKPAAKKQEDKQAADTSHFYPLDVYFKEQIQYVDLRAFPLYKITVKDGKKDSAGLSKEAFTAITKVFLERSISDPATKALYRETSFGDLSTGSLTLNYQPADKNAVVQNVDVLMDENGRAVKRVFIRAVYSKGDTTVTEQCSWKTYKSCQVNRSYETPGGYRSTELNYINWDDKP